MAPSWLQVGSQNGAKIRLGASRGRLGGVLGRVGRVLGRFPRHVIWEPGANRNINFWIDCLSIWAPFWEPTWNHLGLFFGPRRPQRPPGRLQKAFLGMFWGVLEVSWGLLTAKNQQERLLGRSWPDFARFLGGFWEVFGFYFWNEQACICICICIGICICI